jgi:hypothetical protein
MTITVGIWILPLIVTIIAFLVAYYSTPESHGDYGGIGAGFVGVIYLAGAAVVSLLAWLLWALVR